MSSDLNRVSLLNFWASWAEPCEQMNAVVRELAEKFPQVLCLMVSSYINLRYSHDEAEVIAAAF